MEREKMVMTKRKRSISKKKAEREEREEWKIANRMFPTLPSHIVMNIISRLSLKSQIICKHNLNFGSVKPYLLFKSIRNRGISRKFSLIDLDDPGSGIKLEFKPKIHVPNRRVEFASSCNGLLCLSPKWSCDPTYICNPISGEYFTVDMWSLDTSYIGFGYSPKAKQCKVLRLDVVNKREPSRTTYQLRVNGIARRDEDNRSIIENVPFVPRMRSFNAFLNAALHWVDCDCDSSVFIRAFDFDDELFKVIPPPAHFGADQKERLDFTCVGVLRDRLYITDVAFEDRFDIWLMKDYEVGESWIKVFTVRNLVMRKEPGDRHEPIMITRTGEVLMIVGNHALVSYDPVLEKFTNLDISGMKSKFEAFAYFPSLASLKVFSKFVDRCY